MKKETTGRTLLIKIAESAINGDKEKAIRYIERYVEMFPETDLHYPFKKLLEGNTNPDKLKLL